ncbi:MAG TPA: hypothetical protein VLA31_09705, partial [Burkholderiaceae bacterium]|nr:hypothetical protein [Burkholderiaceae bacterium]
MLLNFGSDFLETWQNPVENGRLFADMHAFDDTKHDKGKYVHVGPHLSLTGSNADQWVKVKPGSEAVLALALARQLLGAGGVTGSDKSRLGDYLKPYSLDRAEKDTGVPSDTIRELAKAFGAAPSLALAGGTTVATTEGTRTQFAVNLLNLVAGNIGKTVVFGAARDIDPSTPYGEVLKVVERMAAGDVDLLIVDGANPVYALPASAKAGAALGKVKQIVSLSSAWDETTAMAHLVLPGQSAMERWGDAYPQNGVYSLVQPVMAPIFPVKAAEDTLLSVAATLGLKTFEATPTYRDVVRAAWSKVQKDVAGVADFEAFWRESLQRGGVFRNVSFSSSVRLNPAALESSPPQAVNLAGEGLALLPYPSLLHRDGRGASNPWLQEIPNPLTAVVWDSWADINPETAKKL